MPSHMYPETQTFNPAVGCLYDCLYCGPSFKRQLKRVAKYIGCSKCYDYTPHYHPERLRTSKIPSAPIVFVFGTGEIAFYDEQFVFRTFDVIDRHKPRIKKTYYFQSKYPYCFKPYMSWFYKNRDKIILLTTLETNRDEGYERISKAPPPSIRYTDFYRIQGVKKAVTIEPVLDFDLDTFSDWMFRLHDQGSLEYVWFGFDSKNCGLPEPSLEKAQRFVNALQGYGIEVRGKSLRGVVI